jgi:hypothetical protein
VRLRQAPERDRGCWAVDFSDFQEIIHTNTS